MLKVVGLVLAVLFLGQSQGEDICDQHPHEVCPPDMVLVSYMGPFFPPAEFLDKFCPKMLQSVQCIKSYNDTCQYAAFRNIPPITFGNIYDSVSEICDEKGKIGRGYRENVDCVNGLLSEISMLLVKGFKDVKHFASSTEPRLPGTSPSLEIMCLGISYIAGIAESAIEVGCGKDAARVADLMVESFLDDCPDEEKMRPYVEQFARFISEKEAASDEKEVVEAVEEEVINPNIVRRSPLFPLPY